MLWSRDHIFFFKTFTRSRYNFQGVYVLGPKINPDKSKATSFPRRVSPPDLHIQKVKLQWVSPHTYLGVVSQNGASTTRPHKDLSNSQVLCPEKITSSKQGAGYRILRSFLFHAIHSAASSLILLDQDNSQDSELHKIEPCGQSLELPLGLGLSI